MDSSLTPEWPLNDKWAVSRNTYNWILHRKSGQRWRAESYYRTPELLLKAFLEKLTLTESPKPSLEKHIEDCFDQAHAAADLFKEHIAANPCAGCRNGLAAASTSVTREVGHAS